MINDFGKSKIGRSCYIYAYSQGNMRLLLFTLLLCLNMSPPAFAANASMSQSFENVQNQAPERFQQDEDYGAEPGLLLLLLAGAAFVLLSVGLGIALTILAIVAVLGLVSLGIVSASLLVGVSQKSVSKGFKTFVILSCVVAGATGFGLISWLLCVLFEWSAIFTIIAAGIITGMLSGLIFGIVANYILGKAAFYIKGKFNTKFMT